jgi:hypothetical protein
MGQRYYNYHVMPTHAAKAEKRKAATVAERATATQNQHQGPATVFDNRPAAVAQRQMQAIINQSPQVQQAATLQDQIAHSPRQQAAQQKMAAPAAVQKKANKTGLPDELKAGVEHLSGHSLDDVQVHYNSAKPAQLQAHAYAQGTDIHLASGQEKHLPHEAWHVVQQKQGRVKPTRQLKGQVAVNDNAGLEREADTMGTRAKTLGKEPQPATGSAPHVDTASQAVQKLAKSTPKAQQSGLAMAGKGAIQLRMSESDQAQYNALRERHTALTAANEGKFERPANAMRIMTVLNNNFNSPGIVDAAASLNEFEAMLNTWEAMNRAPNAAAAEGGLTRAFRGPSARRAAKG